MTHHTQPEPEDGDLRVHNGRTEIYRKPPGRWEELHRQYPPMRAAPIEDFGDDSPEAVAEE